MKITEYTLVSSEENQPIVLHLGNGEYYAGYDMPAGIKTVRNIGFASRIATEKFAYELIGFLQNFFNQDGGIRVENQGKVLPPLVGLAETSVILGWDKRKVSTYLKRGVFPKPLQHLSSGPIWTLKQIEDYRDSFK